MTELRNGAFYFATTGSMLVILYTMYHAVQVEMLEHSYPTPDEWSWWSRARFRMAFAGSEPNETQLTDWVPVYQGMDAVVKRLENEKVDGEGVTDGTGGTPTYVDGIGRLGKDVTAKTEAWRRGYYEALMMQAKAAEHLDCWVVDKTRNIVFPPEMVVGPSNPRPKPIPFGAKKAPREEDCELVSEKADAFYVRILTTNGFSAKQKMDAALEYANWLEFKGAPEAAEKTLHWALQLANEATPKISSKLPYDPDTLVIKNTAKPSANLLRVITAMATFKARHGDIDAALPMLVSVLRARHSLPISKNILDHPRRRGSNERLDSLLGPWDKFMKYVSLPPYPSPLPDGSLPPPRDAAALCEEAALNAWIGEIMFAKKGREEGLAWTRDAVDTAEEQLHKIRELEFRVVKYRVTPTRDEAAYARDAKKGCRECLGTGLGNWAAMAAQMDQAEREERERRREREKKTASSWWPSMWGHPDDQGQPNGRWEAETKVVEERRERTRPLMEDVVPRWDGFWASFVNV